MMVSIWIPGEAVGKGRPRVVNRHGFVQSYTPARTAAYEKHVRQCATLVAGDRRPSHEPMAIEITVLVGVPKSWPAKQRDKALAGQVMPTGKPDVDNVAKAILDALEGVVYEDDRVVCDVLVRKRYSGNPGVRVTTHLLGGELSSQRKPARQPAAE